MERVDIGALKALALTGVWVRIPPRALRSANHDHRLHERVEVAVVGERSRGREAHRLRLARVDRLRVERALVGRGGVRGRVGVRPGDAAALLDRDHSGVELERLDVDLRGLRGGARRRRGWGGGARTRLSRVAAAATRGAAAGKDEQADQTGGEPAHTRYSPPVTTRITRRPQPGADAVAAPSRPATRASAPARARAPSRARRRTAARGSRATSRRGR